MLRQEMTKEAAEDVLELPQRYTKADVRRAYTELARQYHPDALVKYRFDQAAAQAHMVEVNKAYGVLKQEFAENPDRVVYRGLGGIVTTSPNVDWHADPFGGSGGDPWDFAEDWNASPVPQEVPLSVRSVLLGPVVLRIVFVALFCWVWWRNFPLLSHNAPRFVPKGQWTLMDVARLVSALVYPSYLVLYESVSGYISGLVREVLNGAVSWVTKNYVDLRPKTSSYGCALYKLLREEVYAVLLVPIVLYLAAVTVDEQMIILKIVLGIVTVVLGVDTLATCTHGGYINVWTSALADRVEARYLIARAGLLKRCGQWEGQWTAP